jgi:hypothetical protein
VNSIRDFRFWRRWQWWTRTISSRSVIGSGSASRSRFSTLFFVSISADWAVASLALWFVPFFRGACMLLKVGGCSFTTDRRWGSAPWTAHVSKIYWIYSNFKLT